MRRIKSLKDNKGDVLVVDQLKRLILQPGDEAIVSHAATIEAQVAGDGVQIMWDDDKVVA